MIITRKFGSVGIEDVIRLQGDYAIVLPQDYVDFLNTYNGGIVGKDDDNKIFVADLSTHIAIDVLYGINTGSGTSDIQTWTKKFQEELTEGSIIIGDTVTQGFIVMICKGEYSGIYYWDDSYHFDESSDDANTYWIAKSFSDFIKPLL